MKTRTVLLGNITLIASAFFIILLPLILGSKVAFAHKLQFEPVVVIVRPQKTFLTVEMRSNGEDINQAIQVKDIERIEDEFKPAVHERLRAYLNKKLRLQRGGKQLKGELLSSNIRAPILSTAKRPNST